MRMRFIILTFVWSACSLLSHTQGAQADDVFFRDVQPILSKYCVKCHSGKNANAHVDFSVFKNSETLIESFEFLDSAIEQLNAHSMPPEDKPQPSADERRKVQAWYDHFIDNVESRPAVFRSRRLAVNEYRNTLRSVVGFDLEVAVIEAEQTVAQKSMVVKLLPTDPPGASGFTNDTRVNRLTTVVWDQYSYLVDAALEELFTDKRRSTLEAFVGPLNGQPLSNSQAEQLVKKFVPRAWRRPVPQGELAKILARLESKKGADLVSAVKLELKTCLMSPSFIFRGLRHQGKRADGQDTRQPVDSFELAERLSYFFWADMPNDRLIALATDGSLTKPEVFKAQIDRMIRSPKARSLTDDFATQWLTLNEIEHVNKNVPQMMALKSQPLDFMNYLFTENRPLLELVDSKTAFANPHTARIFGADAKQMTRYVKQRGIEVEIVRNQKIKLEHTTSRGGILTMQGVLAMNEGPILRGTWVLERILGDELPNPPANVGQVQGNKRGENLTFRQRFEQHRSNATCAICHDKIDPLGFSLQSYGTGGQFIKGNVKLTKKEIRKGVKKPNPKSINTRGQLPTGEKFEDINGLKKILVTTQRAAVIRNIVRRTMSYALCRKLEIYDRPAVESIVKKMDETNGTWRDLFHEVANSVPFRETILSGE